jgi:hypothetical protein
MPVTSRLRISSDEKNKLATGMRLWGAVADIAGRRAGIRGNGAGLLQAMGAVIGCSVGAIMIVVVLRIVGRIVRLGIRRVGAVAEGFPLLLGEVALEIQGMGSEEEESMVIRMR